MASQPAIRGWVAQAEEPSWSALEAALGTELCTWFMWVCEVRLDDGRRIDVYKHITTRRYLHLGPGGSALRPIGVGDYRGVDLPLAITTAFAGWQCAGPELRDIHALNVAVASAQRRAA